MAITKSNRLQEPYLAVEPVNQVPLERDLNFFSRPPVEL